MQDHWLQAQSCLLGAAMSNRYGIKLWHIYGLCWKWSLIVRKFPSFSTVKEYLTSIWIANYPISVQSLWLLHIVDAIIVSITHPQHQRLGDLKNTCWVCTYRVTALESWPTPLCLVLIFLLVIHSLNLNANIYLIDFHCFFYVFASLKVFTDWIHIHIFF